MKYKNIISAIHNFGHSFLSDMNYVENDFVFDELQKIHKKKYDISINWKTGQFQPQAMLSSRLSTSIKYWCNHLEQDFNSQNVDINSIINFKFVWVCDDEPKVIATDDRGKNYEKYLSKS